MVSWWRIEKHEEGECMRLTVVVGVVTPEPVGTIWDDGANEERVVVEELSSVTPGRCSSIRRTSGK
jgi:hypothetical protein